MLPDGLTDESDDVWMEGNFPRSWTFRNFFSPIFLGTFTVNSADGWSDGILMDGWMDGLPGGITIGLTDR